MKTVCIYHSIDLDGWMSAAIVKHWFVQNNNSSYIINGTAHNRGGKLYNIPSIDFIGYNYGQPIPDLSGYDKVIMCDISFPKEEMGKLLTNHPGNVIWIDHHISAINDNKELLSINILYGLRDTKFAACELTWKYFFPNEPVPEIVRLLGRYDCFGHKGTDEEQKVLEFQYGARNYITNYESAYKWLVRSLNAINDNTTPEKDIHKVGKHIYAYLCTEAKQAYKNGFDIKLLDPVTFGKNPNEDIYDQPIYRKFICINKERFNPINFGIDYHKDGYDGATCFHFNGTHWCFSLYNDNGEVDCSQIAKQFGGGGHKGAAGFIINDITKILNNEYSK